MTDVTNRPTTASRAVAEAEVGMAQETLSAVIDGAIAKGDVLSVAELAGVMAGKRAADLIPLVHPAGLSHLLVNAAPDRAASAVRIRVETAALGPTGVEMEAMTAAAVAALTVYDMIRDVSRRRSFGRSGWCPARRESPRSGGARPKPWTCSGRRRGSAQPDGSRRPAPGADRPSDRRRGNERRRADRPIAAAPHARARRTPTRSRRRRTGHTHSCGRDNRYA